MYFFEKKQYALQLFIEYLIFFGQTTLGTH